MIDFLPFDLEKKTEYDKYLTACENRGCEYSFANLYLWGRQKAAFLADQLVFFSQFNRRSVYLFPVGPGDRKAALDAIIRDAADRGIPCRLTGLLEEDCALVERLYPGKFRFHNDRDGYDYVYDINGLSELRGKKYQKKRNHLNRFLALYPDCRGEPITEENAPVVSAMVEKWYALRQQDDPAADYHMEKAALRKAMEKRVPLQLEGYCLFVNGECVAMSLASSLSETVFDVHFEKALEKTEGAYTAINYYFSRYLREKYGAVKYLNREDDMGIPGLRHAKLSYRPDRMVKKSWACLLEDDYDY
ncbi:MAG: DUF2156 domain-containing protein [Oscillospiraceae bacterium]|nr:DUF2156 domain-containing protein [Oscillospiraceae bacterium]